MHLVTRVPKSSLKGGHQAAAISPERAAIGSSSPAGHSAGIPRYLERRSCDTPMSDVRETAGLNAQIAVSNPGDALEQQAEHVADKVMRMPETELQQQHSAATSAKNSDKEAFASAVATPRSADTPSSIGNVISSGGQPLDRHSRNFFEPRLGYDLGGVRIHTDSVANQQARAIDARAFTLGNNIVFDRNEYSPGNESGKHLLAHELTHVIQQAQTGPSLQREPQRGKPDVRPDAKPKDSDSKLTPFVQTDLVQEIKRNNETWTLTINGFSKSDSLKRLIWPHFVPPGVTVELDVALLEPIEQGRFVLNGVTFETVRFMEPSFAKLFSNHGLEKELEESDRLREARYAFLKRHSGHSDKVLYNIVVALNKITKRNPELLIAYYEYYADNNLRDETVWNDHITEGKGKDYDPDVNAGATAYGGTVINPKVLNKTSTFPSDDPISLLAETLIHEYVHTPQGGGDNAVSHAPKEAKAYGIELFFSERMGDKARATVINGMSWNSPIDLQTGADKIFYKSHDIIMALYEVIDQGGTAAKDAREMSVEFISKNSDEYGKNLNAFIAKLP